MTSDIKSIFSMPRIPKIVVRPVSLVLIASLLASCGGGGGGDGGDSGDTVAQPIPAEIQKVFDKPVYKNTTWALRVVDVETGAVLHDLNSSRPMLIASVRKLFSTSMALEALGPEHTLRTPVHRRGTVNAAGVLTGDLIMVASGDLTMGGRTNPDGSLAISNQDHNEANGLGNATLTAPDPLAGFNALAKQVAASGIRQVNGDVIIDDRLFEAFSFRDQFMATPMFVNDDVVDVIIDTNGSAATADYRPKSVAFTVKSTVKLSAAGTDLDIDLLPELPRCFGMTECAASIDGNLPSDLVPPLNGTYPLIRTFRITQPSNYARSVFIEALARAGVTVSAKVVAQNPVGALPDKTAYVESTRVAELVSHPYKEQIKYIDKVSYNIGADTSLMLLGVAKGTTSMTGALAAEQRLLVSQFGLQASTMHFIDGSGDGDTTATPATVISLLEQLFKRPVYKPFRDAQPLLGIDGSLSFVTDFMSDPTLAGARGQVSGKTGTYIGVDSQGQPSFRSQALAGYITTKSGRTLAFGLFANDIGAFTGIDHQVLPVFQDEGTISALLWKLN